METFETCRKINDLIVAGDEVTARDILIKFLDALYDSKQNYDPLTNHLIRILGLFPYMQTDTCEWRDQLAFEAFRHDAGGKDDVVLHREQSRLLRLLLDGKNIAVSAPTSFGKSFVIDAFIALRKPANVVIIVPTLALTDETRRRLTRKFSGSYKLITTADEELADRNIFIFPQERAIGYADRIDVVDMLIIDEFYKASKAYDKDRAPALVRAMLKLLGKSRQRYFLAPHISELKEGVLTEGMTFEPLDFKTVVLDVFEEYKSIGRDAQAKEQSLLRTLGKLESKTLIYAGTHASVTAVATLLTAELDVRNRPLLNQFSDWLGRNYSGTWILTKLISRGVGIHTGQLHRALSQIQVQLFEEDDGIDALVSTSSIIEGVNTSAEQVIIWSNKIGKANLNNFTYKNIIGRGGRMFIHFVGRVYLLEPPPVAEDSQLTLEIGDENVAEVAGTPYEKELTADQLAKLHSYEEDMKQFLGAAAYAKLVSSAEFETSDIDLRLRIARDLYENQTSWNGLAYLNSENASNWTSLLYRILKVNPGAWGRRYSDVVNAIGVMAQNWVRSIPEQLKELEGLDITIDAYFDLERTVSFKLSSLVSDINLVFNHMYPAKQVDVSSFASRAAHAFLPKLVFQLEEYGLPRSIAKKLHAARVHDLTSSTESIHDVTHSFTALGFDDIVRRCSQLDDFDKYILQYFLDGI